MRLLACLCLLPGLLAAVPARLYAPRPTATPAPAAERWELSLLRQPPAGSGGARIQVRLRRHGLGAHPDLLLTVSAQGHEPKAVSRRQARLDLAAGQREAARAFDLEAPDCRPVRIVAALFEAGRPLTRVEQTLSLDCGGQ